MSSAIRSIIKNGLFQNALIYTITNIIEKAIPFFLLPVMTHFLSPTDYGIVSIFQVFVTISVVFIGINLHGAISVNFYKLQKHDLKSYVGGILIILFFNFLFNLIIVYLIKSYLGSLVKIPENLFLVALIIALFQSCINLLLSILRMEERAFQYGIFNIINMSTNISLSLVFIILYNLKWEGRVLGILISSIMFGVIAILLLKKKDYISFKIKKYYLKDALFFGVPLIPHALGGWIITATDRLFINSMIGPNATGLYTVGYQIGSIIGFLTTSFNQAWGPFLFKKLEENDEKAKVKIVKFTYLYFVVIIFLAVFLSIVAPIITQYLVAKDFHNSYKYVLWIALGYAFNGMYYMVAGYIFFAKRTHILAWITFFSAILNILLNYFFIKVNGTIGAAQATTLTFGLTFILTWLLSNYIYKMPWRLKWKNY